MSKETIDKKRKEFEKLGSLIRSTDDMVSPTEADEEEVRCPYCNERFTIPLPDVIKKALDDIQDKDAMFEKEQEFQLRTEYQSTRKRITRAKRKASNMEQYSFCRLHRIELVIKPKGEKKGYPTEIDFEAIGDRIEKFKHELLDVISGKESSTYRETALKAYEDLGKNRARSAMGVMARFETTLPGYYGSKGAAVIFDSLNSMFLHTGVLTTERISPQLPLEYIQQILVPEAGFRLIRDDLMRKQQAASVPFLVSDWTKKAKLVMKESCEFGSLIHTDEDEDEPNEFTSEDIHVISSGESDDEEGHEAEDSIDEHEGSEVNALTTNTPITIDSEEE
ncbi:hypothetical protein DFQ29_005987 [Apophysomyces sp. BC1021]|nr:hypothetical protein DFQ29_005987 [Apophysomyces sp. BC1021]